VPYLSASEVVGFPVRDSRAGSVSFFLKVGIGFRFFGWFFQKSVSVSVSVFQNIAISVFGFSARTYHCLSNNTIADTLRPSISPEWGLGPGICITNCGQRDRDIVTIDNL